MPQIPIQINLWSSCSAFSGVAQSGTNKFDLPVFSQVGFFRYHKVAAWPKDLLLSQTGPEACCCSYWGDLLYFVICEGENRHSL